MSSRGWLVILGAGFCVTALPACAPLGGSLFNSGHSSDSPSAQVPAKVAQQPRDLAKPEESEPRLTPPRRPVDPSSPELESTVDPSPADIPEHDLGPGQRVPEKVGPQPVLPPLVFEPPLPPGPTPLPGLGANGSLHTESGAPQPPENEDPLVKVLHYLLNKQPAEAIKYLPRSEGANQDLLMGLLAAVQLLHEKSVDQLSPEERAVLGQQLQGLEAVLRKHSELTIAKMYLWCVDGAGQYKPVAAGHVFQCQDDFGVHVELHNISSKLQQNTFTTALNAEIRIINSDGKCDWYYNFRNQMPPEVSGLARSECPRNFFFPVPALAPGKYTLTIEVADETFQPRRVAHKSVEFVVAQSAAQ